MRSVTGDFALALLAAGLQAAANGAARESILTQEKDVLEQVRSLKKEK